MPFGSAGGLQKTRMLVAVRFWYITFRGAEGTARSKGWKEGFKEEGKRRVEEEGIREGEWGGGEGKRSRREGRGGEGKGEEKKEGRGGEGRERRKGRGEWEEAIKSLSMSTSRTSYLGNNKNNAL